MSGQIFATYAYLTSEAVPRVLPIRLGTDIAALSGGGSTQALTGEERVKAPGSSRKSYGIHARYYTMARRVGAAGGYGASTVRVKVAVGAPGQMPKIGDILNYQAKTDWIVVSLTPELIK